MSVLLAKVQHEEQNEDRVVGPWKESWRNFKKSKSAVVGLCIVSFFVLL